MGGEAHRGSAGEARGSWREAGGEKEERQPLVGVVWSPLKGDIPGFVGGRHVLLLLRGRMDVYRGKGSAIRDPREDVLGSAEGVRLRFLGLVRSLENWSKRESPGKRVTF